MRQFLHDPWKVSTSKDHKSLIGFTQFEHYPSRMDTLREEIGRRLKHARESCGLTLAEVCAQVAGLAASRLSNWENGTRMADVEVVKKLAPIYSTSAGYLLTLEETPPDPRVKALVELYQASDPRGQDTILRVAESESKYVEDGKRSDRAA